jgi:hypothetical protein
MSFLASLFSHDIKLFTELLFLDNNLQMASTALNMEPNKFNIEHHVLKMGLIYVDQLTYSTGAACHPILCKWAEAILSAKLFLLQTFIDLNASNLSCCRAWRSARSYTTLEFFVLTL